MKLCFISNNLPMALSLSSLVLSSSISPIFFLCFSSSSSFSFWRDLREFSYSVFLCFFFFNFCHQTHFLHLNLHTLHWPPSVPVTAFLVLRFLPCLQSATFLHCVLQAPLRCLFVLVLVCPRHSPLLLCPSLPVVLCHHTSDYILT